MQLKIIAVSDKGLVRELNEDMILIGNDIFRDGSREITIELNSENKYFIAVSDGMGGHNAGEIASELVLRKIVEKIDRLEMNLTDTALSTKISELVKEIHRDILKEGESDHSRKGMGATLIGVLFYNRRIYYMNVGDSRLYRWRNGYLMQISKDHSLKEITGNKDIASNIIINSFGGGEEIFVDFAPIGSKVFDNDILLLCSDGLSDELGEEEIEGILGHKDSAIEILLNEAINKGGEDNISIVLITLSGINNILDEAKKSVII